MPRRIEVLLGDVKRIRAEMQARGLLSDPGRFDTQLMKIIDELAFIVQGQFREIDKLKKQLRKLEKKIRKTRKTRKR